MLICLGRVGINAAEKILRTAKAVAAKLGFTGQSIDDVILLFYVRLLIHS